MLWLILHHLLRARTHSTTEAAMDVVLVTDDTTRDALEAKARKLMAEQHIARGWETQRERADWLAKVDHALDAWLASGA